MPPRSEAALINLCSSGCFLGCSKTLWQDWKNYYRIQNQMKFEESLSAQANKERLLLCFQNELDFRSPVSLPWSRSPTLKLPSIHGQLIRDHSWNWDQRTTIWIPQAQLILTKQRYFTSLPGHASCLSLAFLTSKCRKYLEGWVPQKNMKTFWGQH